MKFKPNLAVLLGLSLALPLSGATVTLNSGDALGASSFNAGTNWSDGTAPSAGNDYVVSVWGLRTPADNASHTFAGDSLTISGNGTTGSGGINFKGGGVDGVITVDNLVLSGGFIQHNQGFADEFHLAGNVTIAGSNTTIHAKQGNIFIEAAVLGTAPLTLQATDNGNGYYVTFSSALNEYTGDVTVAGNFGLAEGGVWNFSYSDGSYNNISGSGYSLLEGVFRIELPEGSDESIAVGTQWTLVGTTGGIGYGTNFSVEGWTQLTGSFSESGAVAWFALERPYRFNLSTGVLERIAAKQASVGGNTVYVAHDWIEAYFGEGSIAGFDANADSDGDGYSNYEEYLAGSNPGAEGASSIPGDVDGDGLPDEWEIQSFGNLEQGPDDDTDGDFNTNLEEYLAETDPASADDFPTVYIAEVDSFMNVGWIEHYFGSIEGFAPNEDPDGDTFSNFEEYEMNTDPTDPLSSPDDDGDGLPDGWELHYFDSLGQGAWDDSDGDGVANYIEYLSGTNPTDAGSSWGTTLGYWRFEEATSGVVPSGGNGAYAYPTSIQDASSYGNHMMAWADYNNPSYSDRIPFPLVPVSGERNQSSLYFERNDSGQYFIDAVFTTPSNLLDPPGGFLRTVNFSELTVEASFNTTSTGLWQVPVLKEGDPVGGQPPFSLKIDTSNYLRAGIVDGSGTAREIIGTTVIEANMWYSAVVTGTATELSLWLKRSTDSDYQLEGTVTISGESGVIYPVDSAWVLGQGMWAGTATDGFAGNIDEVRISSVVLDPSEFLNNSVDPTADTDEDGLPDAWEINHFGNLEQGPDDDPDGDFNTNLAEYLADPQTDPTSADDFPTIYIAEVDSFMNVGWIEHYFGSIEGFAPNEDPDGDTFSNFEEYEMNTDPTDQLSSPDGDGDGLPDGWELHYFDSLGQGAWDDSDGDGVANYIEYLSGTNPTDAGSSWGTTLGYWRFEEATSGVVPSGGNGAYAYPTSIQDASSYGNHMMAWADYSNPSYSTDVPFAEVPLSGDENRASLYFERNDSGQYFIDAVFTTPSNLLDPPGGFLRAVNFSELTVEASFNTTSTGLWQVPVLKEGDPVGGQPPFSLKIDTSNYLRAGIVDGSGTAREIIGTTVIEANAWYSAAVTATATELKLWLKRSTDSDYQLEGTVAISGESGVIYPVNTPWVLGQGMWAGTATDGFAGNIDEVRISSVALTPGEFLNPGDVITEPTNPTADSDGDGTPDVIEEALGLDPNDPTEFFRATLVTGSGSATLSWPSAEGLSFTVERSTTLESWEEVAVVSGAAGTWTDPAPPEGKAFYRVVVSVVSGD